MRMKLITIASRRFQYAAYAVTVAGILLLGYGLSPR
jgi:hypothetical protein